MSAFSKQAVKKPVNTYQKYPPVLVMALLLILTTFPVFIVFAQSVTPVLSLNDPGIGDQDDMCIWIHPDPSQSTIITSDKDVDKLFVYDLNGNTIQTLPVSGQPAVHPA